MQITSETRLIRYTIEWLAQTGSALFGVVIILLLGSVLGVIRPLWWGGEALFPLIFAGTTLVVGGVVYFPITRLIFLAKGQKLFTYKLVLILGTIHGALIYPCFYLVAPLIKAVEILNLLNTLWLLWTTFAVAGLMSTIISCAIVLILLRARI